MKISKKENVLRIFGSFNLYYFGLILLVASLPLSPYLTSVAQFILAGNWILENKFKSRFKHILQNKSILIFLLIFFVHIIGLIYTSDFKYAFHDIKIKLPLLLLPIIIGTSQKLNYKQLKILLLFFVAATTVSTLISTSVLLGLINYKVTDIREISIFISHIRFSLLINIAVFSLVYYFFFSKTNKKEKVIYLILIIWLALFLFILQSITGIIVFFIVGFVVAIGIFIKLKNKKIKKVLITLLIITPILLLALFTKFVIDFYDVDKVNPDTIDQYTKLGNKYKHDFNNKIIENGHYVYLYVSEKEMRPEWNKISKINYDSLDNKNQKIRNTITRYLTSKEYRKDAEGVKELTKKDIKHIEDGYANYIYKNKISLSSRIYKIIWQIDVQFKKGNPSGHSVTQRFEYLKASFGIIKDNFLVGIGTGDLKTAFAEQYNKMNSPLSQRWRLRAHNQFVTFFVTFGLIGFLIIIFAMIYPIFHEKKFKNYFFMIFLIIVLLSMLNEDTLETQAGVTFFTYFYSLFLFGYNRKEFKK
ncbi:MAG: O-antigen ligase family protein [Bacteroidales bacterium]|nr:O-antigen ligase family protein [Bacteroidales bacterium]